MLPSIITLKWARASLKKVDAYSNSGGKVQLGLGHHSGLKYLLLVSRFLLLFSLAILPACAAKPLETATYQIVSEVKLPSELGETSGLHCLADSFLTLNDSGNAPKVYEIDREGRILAARPIAATNADWEAITAHEETLFIGDFGNNAGRRSDLAIWMLEGESPPRQIPFTYKRNVIKKNRGLAHDFDMEALVWVKDALVMFSKSWRSRLTQVYRIDLQKGLGQDNDLVPLKTLQGLPGMVTGADWNAESEQFVLVGYDYQNFALIQPFVAILNRQLELVRTELLLGYRQVEGVCVRGDDIWFTQEGSPVSSASLVHFRWRDNP